MFSGKQAGSPRQKFPSWQTGLLSIEAEGGSVTVAVGVGAPMALAVAVAVAMAVGFIGFSATIRTRQEIKWSPVCGIFPM